MIVLELQCYVLEYFRELSVIALRDFTDALFASPQRKSANDSQIIRARFARDIPEPHCPANSGNRFSANSRLI